MLAKLFDVAIPPRPTPTPDPTEVENTVASLPDGAITVMLIAGVVLLVCLVAVFAFVLGKRSKK